jgi:hypothetical protein
VFQLVSLALVGVGVLCKFFSTYILKIIGAADKLISTPGVTQPPFLQDLKIPQLDELSMHFAYKVDFTVSELLVKLLKRVYQLWFVICLHFQVR